MIGVFTARYISLLFEMCNEPVTGSQADGSLETAPSQLRRVPCSRAKPVIVSVTRSHSQGAGHQFLRYLHRSSLWLEETLKFICSVMRHQAELLFMPYSTATEGGDDFLVCRLCTLVVLSAEV